MEQTMEQATERRQQRAFGRLAAVVLVLARDRHAHRAVDRYSRCSSRPFAMCSDDVCRDAQEAAKEAE